MPLMLICPLRKPIFDTQKQKGWQITWLQWVGGTRNIKLPWMEGAYAALTGEPLPKRCRSLGSPTKDSRYSSLMPTQLRLQSKYPCLALVIGAHISQFPTLYCAMPCLCSIYFPNPSSLRSHLNTLDHLPDPLLSQLPFQARIARLHELDNAPGVFTSGREGFKLGLMHVLPAVWLLGGCGFGGSCGRLCSFRVRGGHDNWVLV
jgi:hypothetical protein